MKSKFIALFILFNVLAFGQSSTNGVYGGYVGSDRWFASMRQSAANQAILMSLGRSRDPNQLPADYVEFAGAIVFPNGNPFPAGRLPDLRIVCRDKSADDVERAPFIDDNGGFYTVFKKGQTYDLFWMYYFGSREQFYTIKIEAGGPRQRKAEIPYRPPASEPTAAKPAPQAPPAAAVPGPAAPKQAIPPDVNKFDISGLPRQATNFEEQKIFADLYDPTSVVAHERLARYYEQKADEKRAQAEYAKANYWRNPSAYAAPGAPAASSAAPAASAPAGPPAAEAIDVDSPPNLIDIPGRASSVAVIIGISNYREASIPKLEFARRDAETMARYLENVAGIRKENIRILTDNGATRSDVEDTIEVWLPRRVTAASTVIVYYAGHGALDPATGETYLVPYEGVADSPSTRMYSTKRLYEKLDSLNVRDVTVLLDSCFSGGGRSIGMSGRPIVITSTDPTGSFKKVSILAATSNNQISSDLERVRHGVFTYFLLKGMRGEGDANRDGWVDLLELYSFVREKVSSTAINELNREQNPTLLGGIDVQARAANVKLIRVGK